MLFSQAIRLGAVLKPQGFGMGRKADVACAFDAAFLATVGDGASAHQKLQYRWANWPFLNLGWTCPVCNRGGEGLDHVVSAHLNDLHRWDRIRIADWIATIEAQQAQPQLAAQEMEAVL